MAQQQCYFKPIVSCNSYSLIISSIIPKRRVTTASEIPLTFIRLSPVTIDSIHLQTDIESVCIFKELYSILMPLSTSSNSETFIYAQSFLGLNHVISSTISPSISTAAPREMLLASHQTRHSSFDLIKQLLHLWHA